MAGWPFFPPCTPTLVDKPPEGERWTHEIKYDGYRTQFPGELVRRAAVLDGEMVVQDEEGRSDFKRLASAVRWQDTKLVFYAFDLLAIDGNDLRRQRCEDRRPRLHELVGDATQFASPVQPGLPRLRRAIPRRVEQMGLEGIVSKRRDSVYRSGDSKDWLKTKVYATGEFVVFGYERKKGDAPSLLLAEVTDAGLRCVDRAIPTIGGRQREELWEALEYLHVDRFEAEVGKGSKLAQPVHPVLSVKARHLKGERFSGMRL